MKITLDLSKLVEDGKLTPADAERLKALAAQETGHLGLNILTGFGVIAASAGAVAILLTAFQFTAGSAAIIGACVFVLGPRAARHARRGDEPSVADADHHRRADRSGGPAHLRRRLAARGLVRHRGVYRHRDPGALQPDGGAGGGVARRLPRRPHRLRARDVFAVDPGADAHHRDLLGAGAGALPDLAAGPRRLRADRAHRGADGDRAGQFRLLDRLAVGRPLTAVALLDRRTTSRAARISPPAAR